MRDPGIKKTQGKQKQKKGERKDKNGFHGRRGIAERKSRNAV